MGSISHVTNNPNLFIDDLRLNKTRNRVVHISEKQLLIRRRRIIRFKPSRILL